MQDRKRETADALQNVGGGLVPEKSSAKRVFTGSYGILTNRP